MLWTTSNGGVGDCIARLPVIKYIEKHYPTIIVHVWVPGYMKEFTKRCFIGCKSVIVRDFTEAAKFKKTQPTYAFANLHLKNIASHMTDHAFFVMNFQPRYTSDKNYPKIDLSNIVLPKDIVLPEKYAVMCTGFTSPVREWLPEHINKVSDHLLSLGITPVFLGRTESSNGRGHVIKPVFREEIDFNKGLNLIDKTDLVQSAKVIEGAQCIIGLDNGLIHVAACTDTKIVVGYTTVFKEHRLPYRNGIMGDGCEVVELTAQDLKCFSCQSKFVFKYNWDFKGCSTGTFACLKLLCGDKYIAAIDKILK